MRETRTILVTGATGFIGNYVIGHLLHHYPAARIVATSARQERAAAAPWYEKVTYIPFDMAGFDPGADYFSFFGRPDLLIHLAWEGLPNYRAPVHLEVNYPRHASLLANMIAGGLKDLTVTGTCLEYGLQEGCLSEDMAPQPNIPYAAAKDRLRRFLDELQRENRFSFKWARLFYMYGKGQPSKSLFSQLEKALDDHEQVFNMSGGQQVRDYLPVEKVAEYVVRIALQGEVTGTINCCSGIPVTVEEQVTNWLNRRSRRIRLNLGYYAYPDYEAMRFWGDTKKLKSILDNEQPDH
jgi:dTDP-6-deoxy-L-talose 4-dehydrogenase (NAD+)